MSSKIYKHIPVSPENYERFCKLGTLKDSLNDVMSRVLDKVGKV